jgi:hypothetical protein
MESNNNEKKRKYDSKYRKKLVEKMKKIKDKIILMEIYNIIKNNKKIKFSKNKNGVFFDMNKLSNENIEKIKELIEENIDLTTSEIKFSYIPYSNTNEEEGLTNKEKNILKKCKNINI